MADKQDEILQELKDLNSIVTTLAEHTIRIDNLTEWSKRYQDIQVPKCEKRFDDTNSNISGKINSVYNRIWWVIGTIITIAVVIIGYVFKLTEGSK